MSKEELIDQKLKEILYQIFRLFVDFIDDERKYAKKTQP